MTENLYCIFTNIEGYDVRLFTKNELISDVLKHYEKFIEIISEEHNEMFISSNANQRFK